MAMNCEQWISVQRDRVNAMLNQLLPRAEGPAATVIRAMRYAVLNGGKRIRSVLVVAACEACGGTADVALAPAAALEMIHTYSLVHDDLPSMDDDDLRRGRPTVHRAFGEAEAVLAGDALLTLAFELLAREPAGETNAAARAETILTVARAAGYAGMVGGQMADLEGERSAVDAERLQWIHRNKTGALMSASAETGALCAGATPGERLAMAEFGASVGLAFQIADDVLDQTATREELGKTPGKDRHAGKATYPALLGLEASRQLAREQVERALMALRDAGRSSPVLEHLARFAIDRQR
jgi:geranylgeranyl diphosphate synthase type II